MPRPGQSRERRPDNRHPSHSIEIRTRNLKESADRHGGIPAVSSRPSAAPTTGRPARHIRYNRDGMKIHPRQASPTTAKRESGIFRPPPAVSPSASIQSCTVLLLYPNIFQLVNSDTEKAGAILNRIDSIWHSLLRSFIRRTVKTPASARRTRISTEYKA